ncbi:hypothetical protein Hanom_Chr13g01184131 [Helianthus anomalus]
MTDTIWCLCFVGFLESAGKIIRWDGSYLGYWTEDMSLLCLFDDDQPPTTREPPPLNRLVRSRSLSSICIHVRKAQNLLFWGFLILQTRNWVCDENWDSCEVSAFCLPDDDDGGLLLRKATLVATIAPLSGLNDDDNLV